MLSVESLKGVGPKSAERLARLGIHSVQDLLFHLPARYQDRTRVTPIGALRFGMQAVLDAEVRQAQIHQGRRRALLVEVADGSGSLTLRFFHFSPAQRARLAPGSRLRIFGEVRSGPRGLELVHPEYQSAQEAEDSDLDSALTPIYPTTEGMHQLTWRDLSSKALAVLDSGRAGLDELLPPELLAAEDLPPLAEALRTLHRPPPGIGVAQLLDGSHPACRRLAMEELLAYQLGLRRAREQLRAQGEAPTVQRRELLERLLQALPFGLTGAQRRVLDEICQDLADPSPMLRLVQGDVGSGKTVVAAGAAVLLAGAGHQVALMAPTELLAEQHLRNLEQWFGALDLRVAALLGRVKGKRRREVLEDLVSGEITLLVGTHALFQDDVVFRSLGLIVVDEQHRFGVHQRLALRDKGAAEGLRPHQLIMTATPIPRTLAMTAYADLDISVIDELPPGRKPVQTLVVGDSRRAEVVERVREACASGRQAYWVCTLIEESEALQCQTAEDTATALREALADLRIGLVHGRLPATEKEAVMGAFKQGELDLLVATTVIEVGVDVPNASLMIIENPERLGLAQLHQLRGRVGRGAAESHCVLLYKAPLSQQARQRLAILRETNDGFVIAQKDLELRGPGEVLGTRQTGELQLRVADLLRDQALLPRAQALADSLLARGDPMVEPLIARWVGDRARYADA